MQRTYSLEKVILLFILGSYFIVSFNAMEIFGKEEMYPFFDWNLFADVPQEQQSEYRVRVHAIGDETFDPPEFFTQIRDQVVVPTEPRPLPRDLWYMRHIGRLLVDEGKTAEAMALRREFERTFVAAPVTYSLVRVRFDVLERWRDGFDPSSDQIEHIRRFTSGSYATSTQR